MSLRDTFAGKGLKTHWINDNNWNSSDYTFLFIYVFFSYYSPNYMRYWIFMDDLSTLFPLITSANDCIQSQSFNNVIHKWVKIRRDFRIPRLALVIKKIEFKQCEYIDIRINQIFGNTSCFFSVCSFDFSSSFVKLIIKVFIFSNYWQNNWYENLIA